MITEISRAKSSHEEIDLAEVMSKIRERAERRKANSPVDASADVYRFLKTDEQPGELLQTAKLRIPDFKLQAEFVPREHYHVNDLLVFHDQTFLRNAYQAILKREPDNSGFAQYLNKLRSGRLNKIDVLASLRYSREGRVHKVRVRGLAAPAALRKLYRLPILGYLLEMVVGIARLPVFIENYRRLEAYSTMQQDRLAKHLNSANAETAAKFLELKNEHKQEIYELFRQQQNLTEHLDILRTETSRELTDISRELKATQSQISQHALAQKSQSDELEALKVEVATRVEELFQRLQQTQTELVLHEKQLTILLNEILKRSAEAFDVTEIQSFSKEKEHVLDFVYSSLQNEFRGPMEDIKERLQIYLPILAEANITSKIVDIGCGRGEWLEVLREAGLEGCGVETNRARVEQCRNRGFEIAESDAIEYLRHLPANSLSAITAFHIIEHLTFDRLVELIDEIVQSLRPGGLVIFETPNPENVIVGSCNFYLDPSHKHPLPSEMLSLLLASRGLGDLRVVKLHPLDSLKIPGSDEMTERFNYHFYGPMDYAVIGTKPPVIEQVSGGTSAAGLRNDGAAIG